MIWWEKLPSTDPWLLVSRHVLILIFSLMNFLSPAFRGYVCFFLIFSSYLPDAIHKKTGTAYYAQVAPHYIFSKYPCKTTSEYLLWEIC